MLKYLSILVTIKDTIVARDQKEVLIMRKYEGMIVLKPDLEEEVKEQTLNRIKEAIETRGKILEVIDWGKRKLAYKINYIKEGCYYIIEFEDVPDSIVEIERRCKISDAIIRYMFTKKDA